MLPAPRPLVDLVATAQVVTTPAHQQHQPTSMSRSSATEINSPGPLLSAAWRRAAVSGAELQHSNTAWTNLPWQGKQEAQGPHCSSHLWGLHSQGEIWNGASGVPGTNPV